MSLAQMLACECGACSEEPEDYKVIKEFLRREVD